MSWAVSTASSQKCADLEVMNLCGLTACPKNAVKPIKEIADIILSKNGGDGCVREFLDSYFDY